MTRRARVRSLLLTAAIVLGSARAGWAQILCPQHPNDFYGQGGSGTAGWALVNAFVIGSPDNFYPQGFPDRQSALDARYADSLKYAQALISVVQRQATTFPTGSSLGGFAYRFDPQIGLPVRRSQSFGPMFAERPQSSGARRLSVAISGQANTWRSLGGVDLKRLTAVRTYPASVTDSGDPEAEYTSTQLSFSTVRGTLGVSYGLTRRVDIGVLFSYGSAFVDDVNDFTLTDLKTGAVVGVDGRHLCGLSRAFGDTTVRTKFEFLERPSIDLALGVDVRLPTGVAEDLMGVGTVQTKFSLIGALPMGRVSPHFNVGYTHVAGLTAGISAHGVDIPPIKNANEVNYTFGADIAARNWLTLAGDVIGRTLIGSYTFRPTIEPLVSELSIKPGNVHLVVGALGGKLLVRSGWLLNLSVAFPLTNGGLKPGITPVIGLERAF
jgi:hypothetical protein